MSNILHNLLFAPLIAAGYLNAAFIVHSSTYRRVWGRYKGSRLVYLAYVHNGRTREEGLEKALRNFFRRVPHVRVELTSDGKLKVIKSDGQEW